MENVWLASAIWRRFIRAAITGLAPSGRRATAHGIFNAVCGVAWFGGSTLPGVLYDRSVLALVIATVILQAIE